jgi:hypothetical protein
VCGDWREHVHDEGAYQDEGDARGIVGLLLRAWVGDQTGHDAILGMDFMVPAGIRLDMADGTLCLPDEVWIQLSGLRQLYGTQVKRVMLDQYLQLSVGRMIKVPIRTPPSANLKLWVTRGTNWVPTVATGLRRTKYLQITNVGDKELILQEDVELGIWLAPDSVSRRPGFVSIGSRRYAEWQNLAFEATTEKQVELDPVEEYDGPLTDRPKICDANEDLESHGETRGGHCGHSATSDEAGQGRSWKRDRAGRR